MQTTIQQYSDLLRTYLRPQWRAVLALAGLLFGSTALQLVNPQILRYFIDAVTTNATNDMLVLAAAGFIGIAVFQQILSLAAGYTSQIVGWTATNALRIDLTLHCLKLDMRFHNERTPGELIERIDGDINALTNFFSQFVILVIGNILLMLSVLLVLYREDWRIGLALTLFVGIAITILHQMRRFTVPYRKREREEYASLFGFLEERLAALDDIRANGGGNHILHRFIHAQRDFFYTVRRAAIMSNLLWLSIGSVSALGLIVALATGVALFQFNVITIGTVFLIVQYTNTLRRPIEMLSHQLSEFQLATAGIERINELYTLRSTINETAQQTIPTGGLEVVFDDVSFSYHEHEPVLQGISFRLQPGEVLGLLGRTGGGKTTITRLLLRLYDPSAGTIRLGGVDIRSVALDDLRTRIGVVTQEVQLFRASIRDNLTLFDASITDATVIRILDELGLASWLADQPNGLDTELSSSLSAGESQLISFARVFLRDPGLVILDEASSRLDPATERLIERAIDKLLHGRTAIIIAHRLGTVERTDRIMILDDGQVVESGGRAELAHDPASRYAHLLRTGLEQEAVRHSEHVLVHN